MLIKSTDTAIVNGFKMPGFPSQEIQKQTVGSAGEQALLEVMPFYQHIKRQAAESENPLRPVMKVLDLGLGGGVYCVSS